MRSLLLTGLILFFGVNLLHGQIFSETGLEVENHEDIYVVLLGIDEDEHALNIGITENRVRSRVNVRLRQIGLKPATIEDSGKGYLTINMTILPRAFNIALSFTRGVTFFSEDEMYLLMGATVYERSITGQFSGSSDFIISTLDQLLDQFLSDYLDAND